jgi:hypothetical protein
MDKVTPTVIGALVIGVILGYLIHGMVSPQNLESQKQADAETQTMAPSAQPGTNEAKIQDALSAAPDSLREGATVMDFPATASGELVELKKGTNDWTCLPDYAASPGKDPMCVDKPGMEWLQSYITQQPPNISQTGLAYMLEGGSDASNTDPFATEPTEGDDWITSPPHTMIFPVGTLDPNVYGTDPKKGGPWIMWANTPFQHLMVPVK